MRLYAGSAKQFVSDTVRNQVADRLKEAFFVYFRYNPSPGEVASWRNSSRAMLDVVTHARRLTDRRGTITGGRSDSLQRYPRAMAVLRDMQLQIILQDHP